jgi:hypothetical protein
MPKSALPPEMWDLSFWDGTDNAAWYMKIKKRIQYVFAGGPRVPEGFFRFRELPKTIFAVKGKGYWRTENTNGTAFLAVPAPKDMSYRHYMCRVQCWSRWSFLIQWPLFINFHIFWRRKTKAYPPRYQSDFGLHKLFTFHIGYKRDSDKVYWPTAYLGGNFE